jgi:hypothetical protein
VKSFWRWTGTIFFALAFVFLVLTGIGTSLPIDHQASCSATYAEPASGLFKLVEDDGDSVRWRPDIASAVLVSGKGPTAVWRETDVYGHTITYRTTEFVDGSILARTIDFVPGMPFGGTWTINVSPVETPSGNNSSGRSDISIREDGKIYNPFFRFLARYVFGYTQSIQTYLENLGRRTHENPQIGCFVNRYVVTSVR